MDLVLECTGKQNLEFAAAYGLVRESGGEMVDLREGRSLGDKRYFGFEREKHIPVIAASTGELARKLIKYLLQ